MSQARLALPIALLVVAARCGSGQSGDTTREPERPPAQSGAPQDEDPGLPPGEKNEADARAAVKAFLELIRQESYEPAWESVSYVMRESYTYEQFLMVAGKLEMEELPCISDGDIDSMEPTSGHVGLGPKDVEVDGFLVRYSCEDGGQRILVIYLDWVRSIAPPGGVASIYWKEAPAE